MKGIKVGIFEKMMVDFTDNEFVELVTTSPTLDAMMLGEYPGTLFESQREAVRNNKQWYFYFRDLQKDILYAFMNKISPHIERESYIIRENAQDAILKTPKGNFIKIEFK